MDRRSDRTRVLFFPAIDLCGFDLGAMRRYLLLLFLGLLAGLVPGHAQTVPLSTSRATGYVPERPLSLPSPNSIWTLGSGCSGCRSGRELWLVTNADHHRRIVRRYDGTIEAGWSPAGDRFFFNDEESDEKGTAYVVDPASLKTIELSKLIAAGDPESARYLEAAHSRLTACRWASNDTLVVTLRGNFDKPPTDQFDLGFKVRLNGAVAKLSLREWPLFTREPR